MWPFRRMQAGGDNEPAREAACRSPDAAIGAGTFHREKDGWKREKSGPRLGAVFRSIGHFAYLPEGRSHGWVPWRAWSAVCHRIRIP
jgi:hypothetical protein